MKLPGSSAVNFFARCTRKRTFSLSFMLLSGVIFRCFSSCLAYFNFVRFFIMCSASSCVSSVIRNGLGLVSFSWSSDILPSIVQFLTIVGSISMLAHSSRINDMSSFCRNFGSVDLLSGALCMIRFHFPLKSSSSSLFCSDPASRIIYFRGLVTFGFIFQGFAFDHIVGCALFFVPFMK